MNSTGVIPFIKKFNCYLAIFEINDDYKFHIMKKKHNLFTFLAGIGLIILPHLLPAQTVEQYEIFELTLKGPETGNPFTDVALNAEFKFKNRILKPEGFYDGNGMYKIRFMPDAVGEWSYITFSNIKELNGKTGKFICSPAKENNHGPVYIRDVFHFGYADGTPFYPVGTTCYAWVWQGDELVSQTLRTLAGTVFNKIRMGIFPKVYSIYINNEPPLYPYEGSKEKGWDFQRFNPVYFQYFEKQLDELKKLGIEADVILFHPYDWGKWGFDNMSRESNDLYLHYVVARMAAFRNVWWSFANEWDIIRGKTIEDWERYARIVVENDPYQHLRSIHNGMKWYDVSKPWITHLSVQTPYFENIQDWRETYRKPVIIDECVYEGDIPTDWGNLPAEELVHRFWVAYTRGAYCTHGETYDNPEKILWWSRGGKLNGESPDRLAFLHKIMTQAPETGLIPFHNLWNKETYLYKKDEYYLYYYGINQQKYAKIHLPKDIKFTIEVIDAWNMTITPVEGVFSGETDIPLPGKNYVAVRARAIKI